MSRPARIEMTVDDVDYVVDKIKDMLPDHERAHSASDALWQEVLEAIRDGARNPSALASAALRTCRIPFSRWCA